MISNYLTRFDAKNWFENCRQGKNVYFNVIHIEARGLDVIRNYGLNWNNYLEQVYQWTVPTCVQLNIWILDHLMKRLIIENWLKHLYERYQSICLVMSGLICFDSNSRWSVYKALMNFWIGISHISAYLSVK